MPEGGVFGFLGPNGAGKTTMIRCLLGLVRPGAGHVRLLGAEVPGALAATIGRVGSIVEQPLLFPRITGRRNLEILARTQGIASATIDQVLDRVELTDRQGDMVKTYSLGMRQRLGIAAALLKDPSLLILDEPANGLDPAGIVQVRELLRSLGAEGRTVFVSSHILSEIQHVADRVAIVARGRLVTQGAVGEVLAAAAGSAGMVARVPDPAAAIARLAEADIRAQPFEDTIRVDVGPDRGAEVTRVLAAAGIYLSELRPVAVDLETVFLELTKDEGLAP